MLTRALSRQASAEALFGSTARGEADTLSDCDILIVDDDLDLLASRTRELEGQGASVASYTFAKLSALASRGALFIQHLKLESVILRDTDKRLTDILAKFSPNTDYSAEIAENALLAHLSGTAPSGPRGMLLAADILYVTVRNFGVLSLAERGIHVYGFDAVTSALASENLIVGCGARELSALRFLKCLYRNGENRGGSAIQGAVEAALAVLPTDLFPKRVQVVNPKDIIAAPLPEDAASPYLILRDLERRFVAAQCLQHNLSLDEDLIRLSRWIANPRAYAAVAHRLAPHFQRSLVELITKKIRCTVACS